MLIATLMNNNTAKLMILYFLCSSFVRGFTSASTGERKSITRKEGMHISVKGSCITQNNLDIYIELDLL